MNKSLANILPLLCMGVLLGCQAQPTAKDWSEAKPLALHKIKRVHIEQGAALTSASAVMPAYETAAERLDKAKNDAADDYRYKNAKWFAQTVGLEPGRFRPFGEWEEMQAVWTTYSNGMVNSKAVRRMFAEQTIAFIRHSNPKVKAHVIVNNTKVGENFMAALDEYGIKPEEKDYVVIVTIPNQTIWHIDYGPFPIVEKKTGNVAFTDFVYYHPRQIDDAIPTRIGRDYYQDATVYRMPFPFEGGNVQADGKGMCATTFRALKNTGFSALKVRNQLKNYMACDKTLIVQDISDDGTGHIDMFFKWVDEDEVMFGKYEDEITLDYDGDGKEETLPMPGAVAPDYVNTYKLNQKRMDENSALFAAETAANGKKFTVHRLSMMTRFKDEYGNLPRTFINSTFTNGVNVYPSYTTKSCQAKTGAKCMQDKDCGDNEHCAAGQCTSGPTTRGCDEILGCASEEACVEDPMKIAVIAQVQKQWEKAMPEWKHVGLRADNIALWSGAIHCITRTIPTGKFVKTVEDGLCLGGKCGCAEGGHTSKCESDDDCFGPAWVCDCNICKGTCKADGKNCTDDADCAKGDDLANIEVGSCQIDPQQACKGQTAGGGGSCGTLSYEGGCKGTTLTFCSNSGEAKQLSCPSCCGWNSDSSSYDCLNSSMCDKCVNECSEAGEKGCSIKSTHAWTCEEKDGCLKRVWTACGEGFCSAGACQESQEQVCPKDEVDAGGGEDVNAGSDGEGADGVAADDVGGGGGGTTTPKKGDDSGCTASNTTPNNGWFVVLMAMFALVWSRRKWA